MPDQHSEDDTTRATAQLPGLDIEIVHRRAANAERISVHMQAMPSFDAFGRFSKMRTRSRTGRKRRS